MFMVKRAQLDKDPKDFADLISQSEAAQLRGVSRAAIGYLVTNGKLRYREVLGRKFVYRSEVLSFEPGKPGPKTAKAKEARKSKQDRKPSTNLSRTKSKPKASKTRA